MNNISIGISGKWFTVNGKKAMKVAEAKKHKDPQAMIQAIAQAAGHKITVGPQINISAGSDAVQ